jgi:hypothetical protein
MNLKLVSVLSIVGLLAACGDSGSSASTAGSDSGGSDSGGNGGTTNTNGGNGPGPTPTNGGGPGNGGGPAEDCIDEGAAAVFDPELVMDLSPQAGLDACTAAAIDGFFSECTGADATMATCSAWTDANQPCLDCLFAIPMDSTHWAPLIQTENGFLLVNVAACEAQVQMLPNCVVEVVNPSLCTLTACDTCETDEGFDTCLAEAASEACADLMITPACEPVDMGMSPECGGMSFLELATNVSNHICGAP